MSEYNRRPDGYDAHPSDDEPIGPPPDMAPEASDGSFAPTPPRGPAPDRTGGEGVMPTAVFCMQCGYNLTGVAIGGNCPECGTRVLPLFQSHLLPTSGKAVASLVLGICSIIGCLFYGIPALICGPLALVFGNLARKDIASGKYSASSQGMATAGIVCGSIGLGLVVVGVLFVLGMFILSNL